MTGPELIESLLTLLSGTTGQDRAHWQKVLGSVQRLSLATGPACNWQIEPSGSVADVEAAEKAIEIVRAAYPYVR